MTSDSRNSWIYLLKNEIILDRYPSIDAELSNKESSHKKLVKHISKPLKTIRKMTANMPFLIVKESSEHSGDSSKIEHKSSKPRSIYSATSVVKDKIF